ncbi:MAG: molybdenum cofactor biosynthesis protein MoaE [Sulfolobales archaeon]
MNDYAEGLCDEFQFFTRENPPDFNRILSSISRNASEKGLGGVVIYIGVVKNPVEGRIVRKLSYEVYEEYTLRRFSEIARDIKSRYSVECLKIYHVKGDTLPGDIAVIIVAQSIGRRGVFEAVRETIDLVKHTTGIWKIEEREDGVFWVLGEGERISRRGSENV